MMYFDQIKTQISNKLAQMSHKGIIASTAVVGAAVGASFFIVNHQETTPTSFPVQSADADGICGSAHSNTLFSPVTVKTPGLCKEGQESNVVMQDKTKPYTVSRSCVGGVGYETANCKANLIVMDMPKEEKKEEKKVLDTRLQAWKKLFNME